ncbi:MAG TPA: nucleoside 2-deoxyribosyltransferase domain-containing protein [Bryobacteraceae bacterium]|nr:nucleoside 2-deoxyribosyltransferase domain-containing protein [Bryobacteraceae bacterium]
MTHQTLVFLGGTCGNNKWRESFTAELVRRGFPGNGIFNPVVPDWTPEAQLAEDRAKDEAWMNLFYIADPRQESSPVSVYSIVEAVMGLYDSPDRTLVVFDLTGISGHVLKALQKTYADLKKRFPSRAIFDNRGDALDFLLQGLAHR